MSKEKLTADFLYKEYVEKEKSTPQIAKELGMFPEQIKRALKKYNIPVRTKSEASRKFYENGGENSRKGYKFTEEEKEKVAVAVKNFWLTGENKGLRKKISKTSKKMWSKRTKEEKQEIIRGLHQKCREASENGSRSQNLIANILRKKYKYSVITGLTSFVSAGNLEIDIYLPKEGIVIEVDGIVHREQIYDDDRYDRAREFDKKKNDILNKAGVSVIRVRLMSHRFSKGSCYMTAEMLHKMIQEKTYSKGGVSYMDSL